MFSSKLNVFRNGSSMVIISPFFEMVPDPFNTISYFQNGSYLPYFTQSIPSINRHEGFFQSFMQTYMTFLGGWCFSTVMFFGSFASPKDDIFWVTDFNSSNASIWMPFECRRLKKVYFLNPRIFFPFQPNTKSAQKIACLKCFVVQTIVANNPQIGHILVLFSW